MLTIEELDWLEKRFSALTDGMEMVWSAAPAQCPRPLREDEARAKAIIERARLMVQAVTP